jgi:hypothetical protein
MQELINIGHHLLGAQILVDAEKSVRDNISNKAL